MPQSPQCSPSVHAPQSVHGTRDCCTSVTMLASICSISTCNGDPLSTPSGASAATASSSPTTPSTDKLCKDNPSGTPTGTSAATVSMRPTLHDEQLHDDDPGEELPESSQPKANPGGKLSTVAHTGNPLGDEHLEDKASVSPLPCRVRPGGNPIHHGHGGASTAPQLPEAAASQSSGTSSHNDP